MRIDQIESNEITGSVTVSGSLNVTGSVGTTTGLTGSLFGTASLAQTASYVLNAVSSSFATTASFAVSSSRAVTSSFAITASFALNAGSGGGGSGAWASFIKTSEQVVSSGTQITWDLLRSVGGITQVQPGTTAGIRIPSGSWLIQATFAATKFSNTTAGEGQVGVYRSGSGASMTANGMVGSAFLAPTTATASIAPKPVFNGILYVTASTDISFWAVSNVGTYSLGDLYSSELTITSL